jgi:hypothetical protein
MMIIGCDLHTRYQQIAMLDTDTGEVTERRLEHEDGEARAFYSALVGRVRVGIEATGHTQWFEAMLGEMDHELWVGNAAQSGSQTTSLNGEPVSAQDSKLLPILLRARLQSCQWVAEYAWLSR